MEREKKEKFRGVLEGFFKGKGQELLNLPKKPVCIMNREGG